MNFLEKLLAASRQQRSLLCVGLDPEPSRFPAELRAMPVATAVEHFCRTIIEATAPYVCAYKPNLAFFEVLGPLGMQIFQHVLSAIPAHIPVIADGKRGDVGNTARNYATALFDVYGCDAATVNPYLGYDSVAPFLAYREKGVFLVCRTSNPSARDFQDLLVQSEDGQARPLYEAVARHTLSWNEAGNCGLVVGATYPQELQAIRSLCPDMPILIPGVGAQGGDLEAAVAAGVDAHGERAIVAVSRAILYAADGTAYAAAAENVARSLRDRINEARGEQGVFPAPRTPEQPPMIVALTCFRCGAANLGTRQFCVTCGYDLSDKLPNPDQYLGPNGRLMLARLTIQSGQMAGRSYLFHQVMTQIGRTNGNDLIISGRTIARHQARLWFDNGHWYLEDLQSANGTMVNHARIYEPTQLNDGDILGFGDEVVLFNIIEAIS